MTSLAATMLRRDIISSAEGIPSTFSSWDSCMSKAYCKWPVIAGIVIGSLILLSVIWCLARCMCCGAACCCSCLRCLDCFTPGRHKRDTKNKDEYRPMPNQGFQPMPSPMIYQTGNTAGGPQFATFDNPSRKINEDSLPAMPTWDNAPDRRIEDENEDPEAHAAQGHGADVEMGRVNSNGQQRGGYSQLSNGLASPPALHSPYRPGTPPQHSTEYFGAGALAAGGGAAAAAAGAGMLGAPGRTYSPAPTYATHDPQQNTLLAASGSDSFTNDGLAPTPQQYRDQQARPYGSALSTSPPTYASRIPPPQQQQFNQNTAYTRPQPQSNFSRPHFSQQHSNSYANTMTSNSSTRYEPSTYPSQPQQQSYSNSYSPPQQQTHAPLYSPIDQPQQQSRQYSYDDYPSQHADGSYERVSLSSPTTQRPPVNFAPQPGGRKPVGGGYREI